MDTSPAKLLWVATPLLLAAAAMAWWALRGRLPSRQGLNVGFSLLLLAYVLTTAGLGIFWVSNQQLPVFDWHYLFGYATVLLLLVHLAFNLRMVWHHLRRKAGTAPLPPAQAGADAGRRPWLGAVGLGTVALAAGLGYLLGLRHGRTEFRFSGDPAAGPAAGGGLLPGGAAHASAAAAQAWAVVQQFHAYSGHTRRRVLRHAASSDWGLAPPPFKRYPGVPRTVLPSPRAARAARAALPASAPALEDARTRAWADLGSALWHTTGISAWRGGIAFRTSPSSGALFATELYLLAFEVPGLDVGPWHYDPEHHALHRLAGVAAPAGSAAGIDRFGPLPLPAGCQALVIASAIFARSGHKYGDRTYRYVLADLGHALENLRVATRERGTWTTQLLSHFDDAAMAAALGLDTRREGVLAMAALSGLGAATAVADIAAQRPTSAASNAVLTISAAPEAAAWRSTLAAGSSSGSPATLGLTEAMQAATSLQLQLQHSRAAAAGSTVASGPPLASGSASSTAAVVQPSSTVQRLPPARALRTDMLRAIAQRRSQRRFAAEAISQQALADILAAMTAVPAMLSAAVRIDLLTAAAQGLPPSAWRHDAASGTLHQQVHHGPDLRRRARAAALDQDVIGDAAVVFVLSLDIAALRADPFGAARGYRHGFIEAGLVGERLYLAAGALGLGVCAVGAFYDDEAAALVGLDPALEWPVHFAALGVPG